MRFTPFRTSVALALAAVSATAAAHAQARPLAPVDLFAIETAADPQISPDGQWIAYVRHWNDAMTDKQYTNIWLVKSDGTGHRPVTSGKTHD